VELPEVEEPSEPYTLESGEADMPSMMADGSDVEPVVMMAYTTGEASLMDPVGQGVQTLGSYGGLSTTEDLLSEGDDTLGGSYGGYGGFGVDGSMDPWSPAWKDKNKKPTPKPTKPLAEEEEAAASAAAAAAASGAAGAAAGKDNAKLESGTMSGSGPGTHTISAGKGPGAQNTTDTRSSASTFAVSAALLFVPALAAMLV
jgi:hypothetical protein